MKQTIFVSALIIILAMYCLETYCQRDESAVYQSALKSNLPMMINQDCVNNI